MALVAILALSLFQVPVVLASQPLGSGEMYESLTPGLTQADELTLQAVQAVSTHTKRMESNRL